MWNKCKDIQDYVVALRRDLHQIPEVGLILPKTSDYVAAELDKLGVPYVRSTIDSGIIATIEGGKPGKTIALRADMDALPILEDTGLPFASCHTGFMHACGHDAHTAMLLGTAKVLNENKAEINGTVRLLFQTSEEQSRGAEATIANGGVDGADAVFGTHIGCIIDKNQPSGTITVTPGCCMASFDKFVIKVKGNGCHGSTPEKGVDPVNIAAQIVLGLQTIRTRELNATRPLVLTIGKIAGGSQYNIIPEEVVIEGTTRTLEDEVRQYAARRIGEISQGIAATYGAEVDYEMIWGAPPVVNDDAMAALAAKAAKKIVGGENVVASVKAPNMGGEDFAYYLQKVPGAFMFLSSSNPEKGTDVAHHNPKFDIDEDVLWQGPALFVSIVEDFLNA